MGGRSRTGSAKVIRSPSTRSQSPSGRPNWTSGHPAWAAASAGGRGCRGRGPARAVRL